ncbi:hypothetical protein D3C72_1708560 [compost metagenome]
MMAVTVGLSLMPICGRAKKMKNICTRNGVLRMASTKPMTSPRSSLNRERRATTPRTPMTVASDMPAIARPIVARHAKSSSGRRSMTAEKSRL